MRRQTFLVLIVALIVFTVRCFVDANGYAGAVSWLVGVLSGVVMVSVWHLTRKFYMDHTGVSLKALFTNASPDARLNAVAVFALAMAIIFAAASVHAQDVATYVPPQAKQYLPMLHDAINTNWNDVPNRSYVAALIEHESGCYWSKGCWNPKSEFKTKRERGIGFSQFTVAYNDNGSVRFDKISELSVRYPQLRELTWANVAMRPDLQLTATTLGVRDTWREFKAWPEALEFTDAAWNGGAGGVRREQRTCKLVQGCDPGRWWGNVERYCMKSHSALYGQRSACDINRFHVRDVWARMPKYRGLV